MLEDLPPTLKTKCVNILYSDIINSVDFLRNLSQECVSLLVTKMTAIVVPAGEYVYLKGSVGSTMYIIQEGEVCEILMAPLSVRIPSACSAVRRP